jgi:tetratricopeptide (TPR) repeat protein
LRENAGLSAVLNTIGRGYQYCGNYPKTLEYFTPVLESDKAQGAASGQVTRWNNIGNIHHFQSVYISALECYQGVLKIVNESTGQPWYSWGRNLPIGNIASWQIRNNQSLTANAVHSTSTLASGMVFESVSSNSDVCTAPLAGMPGATFTCDLSPVCQVDKRWW